MIDFIKKVWEGPTSVKLSLVFVLFVLFCIFLTAPLAFLFWGALIYAVKQIVDWTVENE